MPPDRPVDPSARLAARLELFGGPALVVDDETVSLSPLQSWLLAVLGWANGDGLSRERLVHLLWNESPDRPARHRLSQLLYSLKSKVEPVALFDTDAERVRLDPSVVRVDLESFTGSGERTDRALVSSAGSTLLPDLPPAPTRACEEWLYRTRAGLRAELRERATRIWSNASASEDWIRAKSAARALLELDPGSEESLRRLMLARGMSGRVEEAIAAFLGFEERRAADPDSTGWTPAPETVSLLTRLQELEAVPQPPPEVEIGPGPRDPPLCGRQEEAAALGRVVASPDATGITTVVVSGEGGIGKTRLVEEVARNARLRDYLVLRGGTSEFEQDIPLNLLLDALDHEKVGDALNRLEDPWRSVLLSLLPQFHRDDGPLPEVPEIRPGNIPRRMYQAVHRLVETVAESAPLFLFLDDFQWSDETSVAALEFFRKRWNGGRTVLILGLRRERLKSRSPALRFAEELLTEDRTVHVPLGELPPSEAQRLVQETAERELKPDVCRQISNLGGRSPFFLVELTHEYLDGRLDEWIAGAAETLAVPLSIRQVLESRFSELTRDDVHLLEVLTIHDRPLPWSGLPGIAQRDPARCVECVERLQALRLVSWEDEGLALRHELIRHAVYGRMSRPRRTLLHERVARGLLDSDGAEHPDELALHFDRAGIEAEALEFSLLAADRAEVSGAVPEALHFLKMARRNTDDPVIAADIVGRLGHLNYLHRNLRDAAPLLELAATRFREQGRIAPALHAEVERIDTLSRMESLPLQDFLVELRRIKQEAREEGEWETLARALDVEVHALDRRGDIAGVRRVLSEVEAVVDCGSPIAKCTARTVLAIDVYYRRPADALRYAREAVEFAKLAGDKDRVLTAINRLLVVQIAQGRFFIDNGAVLEDEARTIARTSSDLLQRFCVPANMGFWYMEVGDFQRANLYYSQAKEVIRNTNAQLAQLILEMNLAELEFLSGRIRRSLLHHSKAEALPKEGVPYYVGALWNAGVGLCEIHLGHLAKAQEQAKSLPTLPEEWVFDPFLIVLFKTRLLERMQSARSAVEYLSNETYQIQFRFLTAWVKLKKEEVRLWKKVDEKKVQEVSKRCLDVTTKLQMHKFSEYFRRHLNQ